MERHQDDGRANAGAASGGTRLMTYQDRLGRIPADHYWREDVLAEEIERIFKPSWLCVGFTQDLQADKDFITAQIGPNSIVVQNFNGELKAFRNVCSHRFSRIQCGKGNRVLQCPYHGWTYDAAGKPIGIPLNAQSFGLDAADKDALALHSYALETVGHFVFVRMSSDGPDLATFLGSFYDDLKHVSEVCPDRFEQASYDWAANWKLGMDNAAEGYHVPLVHADSFGLILSIDLKISTDAEHSRYVGNLKERSLKWWGNVAKSIKLEPSDRYPQYGNFLIFPNIVVTFSYGAFLTFQTFDPTGPQTLRINSTSWLAKNNGRAARGLVVDSLKAFSEQVRNEDRDICALAQAGTREAPPGRPPLLGELEGRIAHFQTAYAARMAAQDTEGLYVD
ncbi:aromatic ring-hydroxylating dioxygenase subunit alpha [Asticcacaulis sp. 201]|uniref:aromatic ring-hydroxylating oxygenase subunit alpha n=1 Tax=Asticcacaulis sp. 201 TaxID=3028787 RepID=UPI0029167A63|nr:aromatic ring-hydroxylating dioxygenase subunit alpha [Asticcacaulis sp. 201]MDV6331661.1 aromatic ring-hydroxylating dioxygenase subunit alpha [Asticcacaulis sp. 201]